MRIHARETTLIDFIAALGITCITSDDGAPSVSISNMEGLTEARFAIETKEKKMNETLKNECELLRTRANLFISLIVGFFGLQWFSSFTLARTLATVGTH